MLGRRDPQGDLFRPDNVLRGHVGEDSFYGLLAQHGGEWFSDESFSAIYRDGVGRPSVSPSHLCVALLLQSHDRVSDEEAIARSAYDLRWKVALGLELDQKLCAKSTLQRFRAQLVLNEGAAQILEQGIQTCRQAGLLNRGKLSVAIDTTPILGRGAVKDTYNLVSDAIREVVQQACELRGWERSEIVEQEGLSRHFAASFKGAVEIDWSDEAQRRALVGQLVADAQVALQVAARALEGSATQSAETQGLRSAQRLLGELLAQDIEEHPEDGGEPKIRQGTAPDRVVSTTDPEMRHGRKSHAQPFTGFKATVVADTEDGVILATDVRAGNVADRQDAAALVASAAERSGQRLDEVLGDTAYGDLETRDEIEHLGAEVVAKAVPGTRAGKFAASDFEVDPQRGVARCPAGVESTYRHRLGGHDARYGYHWAATDCAACRLRSQCTSARARGRTVTVTENSTRLWRLREQQKTEAFRTRYRKRVVVEQRIARLVQLGIRQAKYLGTAKVELQVALAATVANLFRAAACRVSVPCTD